MLSKDNKYALILLTPAFALVIFLFIYPLSHSFYLSFLNYDLISGEQSFAGFKNYIRLFGDPDFLWSMARNLFYTAFVVTFNFIIGFAFAELVIQKFPGRGIIQAVILLPMLLMPAADAITWRMLYNTEFGLINNFLATIGLDRVTWLAKSSTALLAVMIADIWAWTPWMFLVLLAGLQSLPQEVFEAARVDGASTFKRWWNLTLPLMKPVIFVAVTLKSVDTFRTFDYIWIMTKGGPGGATHVLSSFGYLIGFSTFRFGTAAAVSTVAFILAFLLALGLIRFLMRRTQ